MAQTIKDIKQMPTEALASEFIAAIARLQSERDKLREQLQRLINNVETGNHDNIRQCIDECKRALGL
jgi:hypothetical protein